MSSGRLHIGEIKNLNAGDRQELCAVIDDNGILKELKYVVDSRYGKYLVHERSDAFVVALLYYAMFHDFDIEWEAPCDEKLIYQLETYFIPIYSKEMPFMRLIKLTGPVILEGINAGTGVATGFSNGVDSCYTIYKYLNTHHKFARLTHLVFTNWFLTDFSDDAQIDFMTTYMKKLPVQAKELGLEFVFVDFKIDTLFSLGHTNDSERGVIQDEGFYTLKFCSIALALQKLIGTYYFSGGYYVSDFTFKENDMTYHDIFTLPLISSSVQFYSVGTEVSRLEKIKVIADWEYARNNLQVCMLDNDCNCGRCGKCIRTLGELYVCDKHKLFNKRFPVDDFMNNLSKRFAKILVQAYHRHSFECEIVKEARRRNKRIPFQAYILFPVYLFMEFIRIHLRENRFARKMYRRFNMDIKIYGKKTYAKHLDDGL